MTELDLAGLLSTAVLALCMAAAIAERIVAQTRTTDRRRQARRVR